MKVLVTAGGTAEPIDAVRSITNHATGRLGSLIADAFGAYDAVSEVIYVCGPGSALPQTTKAVISPIGSTSDLSDMIEQVLTDNRIEVIVHSMAVSDYRVREATTARVLAESLFADLSHSGALTVEKIERALISAQGFSRSNKISSTETDMILFMEQTEKVIGRFKELAPKALLVGFKLLHGVAHDDLMAAARRLLARNGCDFVLANDLAGISGDAHIGYLLDAAGNATRYSRKEEIAAGIAMNAMARF